jgi:5-methylcytosine-specific restriction enzyme subunit McrC
MYQQLEEALITPKGSINFKRYINNSLSNGNWHKIECDYEPFLFDNRVNRIIKYCTRLLMSQTKNTENQNILQEIIFILDEVDDLPCTVHDIDKVRINPYFEEYNFVMDICRVILSQQLYSNSNYDLSQWCLLFPMEYIFEDFFAGFLKEHFSNVWDVKYQKSDKSLAQNSNGIPAFRMQHDIFLVSKNKIPERKIIIDTKYKRRDPQYYKSDNKKGIAQSDLYQVTSYAFRRGCTDVFLVYPNYSDERLEDPDIFYIISDFPGYEKMKIKVTAMEIPFWSFSKDKTVKDFAALEQDIKERVEKYIVPL